MDSANSVSILIQGPYNPNSLQTLARVLPSKLVEGFVLSTWEDHFEQATEALAKDRLMRRLPSDSRLTIIASREAEIPRTLATTYPQVHLQVWSTLKGLEAISSKWVIKVRSDEVYDLREFLRTTTNMRDGQILSSNFIVRDWNYHRFHISDHLFAVETKVLRSALEALSSGRSVRHLLRNKDMETPESLIGASIFSVQPELHHSPSKKQTNRTLWRLFRDKVVLFDLDSQPGSFEVHARKAGVGPVTALSELRGMFNPAALPLDYRHFNNVEQLRPRSAWVVAAGKAVRQLLRALPLAWRESG